MNFQENHPIFIKSAWLLFISVFFLYKLGVARARCIVFQSSIDSRAYLRYVRTLHSEFLTRKAKRLKSGACSSGHLDPRGNTTSSLQAEVHIYGVGRLP